MNYLDKLHNSIFASNCVFVPVIDLLGNKFLKEEYEATNGDIVITIYNSSADMVYTSDCSYSSGKDWFDDTELELIKQVLKDPNTQFTLVEKLC